LPHGITGSGKTPDAMLDRITRDLTANEAVEKTLAASCNVDVIAVKGQIQG
jgi:hypothetical protein